MPGARHVLEEHTSEVKLHVEAPSWPELLAEAGRALAELMVEVAPPPTTDVIDVHVTAPDRDALLVDWLNELIYWAEREGKVFTSFDVTQASATEIRAVLRGARVDELRTQVKAATLHEVSVQDGDERVSARVVLDV